MMGKRAIMLQWLSVPVCYWLKYLDIDCKILFPVKVSLDIKSEDDSVLHGQFLLQLDYVFV